MPSTSVCRSDAVREATWWPKRNSRAGTPTSQAIAFVIDLALQVISNPRPRNLRIDISNVDEPVWIQDP
jgi:hypothetical protein